MSNKGILKDQKLKSNKEQRMSRRYALTFDDTP